uniref:DDE Tnp4 domain-containing protein n=1 Tax=Amphimedon queenslandica TaxID=400682 RepID=A0A1X7SVZ4_AMPQE
SCVACYSNYKKHNTVKVLIAVTPTGSICFISKAWGGCVSDKVITQESGFLRKICRGDKVMADRGFNIEEDLAVIGAQLLIPPFTRGKSQLSGKEVVTARHIARARVHVEHVIGQLRKKYKILRNTLPISLIKCPSDKHRTNCTIDRILIATAALTNLSPTVVT